MLSLKIMNRVSIQIDSPSYVKVSEIGKELVAFSLTIERKYPQIDFEFAFCFRALYTTRGIRSKGPIRKRLQLSRHGLNNVVR